MSEHSSRQVDCGSADDGPLDEEAPDLGPLRKTAEAAELAERRNGIGLVERLGPIARVLCNVASATSRQYPRSHLFSS